MHGTDTKACINRRGTPRRAYVSEAAAEHGAHLALLKYNSHIVPYRCTRCSSWHLSPFDRHTPCCHCETCGKEAYESEASAERRAAILERERGVGLRVYDCPRGYGWHLTSQR